MEMHFPLRPERREAALAFSEAKPLLLGKNKYMIMK